MTEEGAEPRSVLLSIALYCLTLKGEPVTLVLNVGFPSAHSIDNCTSVQSYDPGEVT